MVPKILKEKAIELRDSGHSYKFIEKELGLSRSTLSGWFSGRPFNPNQYTLDKIRNGPKVSAEKRIKERIKRTELAYSKAQSTLGRLNARDLLILGLGLYMGEGSKTSGVLRFANSDPNLIRIFIKWVKVSFKIPNNNFTLRVHSYPDVKIGQVEKYWLNMTGLPKTSLRHTIIDVRRKVTEKKGKLPYGTAHVTVLAAGKKDNGIQLLRFVEGCTKEVYKNIENAGLV